MPQVYLEMIVKTAIYSLACLLAHWPCNRFIRKTIRKWKPDEPEAEPGGANMGAFIGTLERILMIVLVGLGSYAAVGFIVAMKSIARYDKIQKEKAFAEYFLAGTMLSILLALLLALLASTVTELLTQ